MIRRISPVIRALLLAVPFLLFAAPATAFQYVGPNCSFHTIQAAINAASAPFEVIYIAPGTYDELLTINDKTLTIQGGATFGCNAGLPAGATIVSGASHAGNSVVTAGGPVNLFLHDLTISDGVENSPGGHGGGIDFGGHGSLELFGVTLYNNYATYGGGLDVTPDGATMVKIRSGTQILGNTAGLDGGGIHIDGRTRLFIDEPMTLLYFNHAARNGGAIDVTGPARVDIGSPGFGVLPVILSNAAQNGGGISALAHDQDNEAAVVRLFSTDPNHPVTLQGNAASNVGGAIYLKPFEDFFLASAHAALCAYNFRIIGNFAAEGAAIYADNDPVFASDPLGSHIYLNRDESWDDYQCNPEPVSNLGGVARCADGVPCNEIANNGAATANGVPTDGSTILLQDGARFNGGQFRLEGNDGGYAIRTLGQSPGGFEVNNCLIAGNHVTHELVRAEAGSASTISNCTLANDVIGAARVIYARPAIFLQDSIVAEEKPTLDSASTDLRYISYVLSNDTSTLSPCIACVKGDPRFANATAGDYHLQQTSPAIDFAPSDKDHLGPDLDGKPREVELSGINSATNPRDLGAYELQSADVIFNNGFQQVP